MKTNFNAVSKWLAVGQGLQITKWPAVQLFPINLEICWVLSNETPIFIRNHQVLLLTTIWLNFNVLSFLSIGSNGLFDGTWKKSEPTASQGLQIN